MKFYEDLVKMMNDEVARVIVGTQQTNELYNVTYQIVFDCDINELCLSNYTPASRDDEWEREKIITFFINAIHQLKQQPNTRQICYQPKYEGQNDLAACISCLQLIIRHNTINLHVFCRSQNFAKNFKYDNQTYAYVMKMISAVLNIPMGNINVNVISLHEIV